ncbi:MAG: plastocyanin/azurin family copper-binding protein [Flavobacteriaceae bacterium]|nr:plastocyanin/azurin family copper-binding protein [Flavobacteriaceae bacterium]
MKKLLLALFILSSFNSKGTIHTIGVWGGYYEFVPASITIQLGDTLEWEPFAGLLPMMLHTITSDNIPSGAVSFDQVWQMPADTFFQYIPQVAGLYEYVCTPHIPNGMIGEFTVIDGTAAIKEHTTNIELFKITDLLGRERKQTNQPLFYIYDDGTVEKRIVIE